MSQHVGTSDFGHEALDIWLHNGLGIINSTCLRACEQRERLRETERESERESCDGYLVEVSRRWSWEGSPGG